MTGSALGFVDIALGSAVLLAAGLTLIARSRTTQAMGFLTLGAILSTLWVWLGSVDVALAEAALGSGVLGAILVWLAVADPQTPHDTDGTAPKPYRASRMVIGLITGALAALVAISAWVRLTETIPGWVDPLQRHLPATGVTHEVTGVLLAFRAYDTLLESAVLLLAAVAVMALGRGDGLSRVLSQAVPGRPPIPSTLSWIVRFSAPLLLLLGVWLLFAGSSGPGGAFQSGAVLCALLILMHTVGLDLTRFVRHWIRPLLVSGVIVFIVAASLGPLTGDAWLTWDPRWAFVVILAVEILLTAGIAVGLFVIYLALENPRVANDNSDAQPQAGSQGAAR